MLHAREQVKGLLFSSGREAVESDCALADQVPEGRALDTACGTGRHTKYLAERGFETTGVDVSVRWSRLCRDRRRLQLCPETVIVR